MKREEDTLYSLRFERGVFLDSDGNILFEITASPEQPFELEFPDDVIALIAGNPGAVFTHNHPRGWEYPETSLLRGGHSFSPDDVRLACKSCLSEMRAISPVYVFQMQSAGICFQPGDWAIIEIVLEREGEVVDRLLTLEVLQNRISAEEYEVELLHQTWMRVAGILGLVYKRTHWKDAEYTR